MRSLRLAICAFAALALASCATTATERIDPGTTVEATDNGVTIPATRALIIANNAYQGAVAIMTPLVRQGRFSATQLDEIEKLNDRAILLLEGGGGAIRVADRAAEVFGIADRLSRLAGR